MNKFQIPLFKLEKKQTKAMEATFKIHGNQFFFKRSLERHARTIVKTSKNEEQYNKV